MIRLLSDRALLLDMPSPARARQCAHLLREQGLGQDVVPGLDSVALFLGEDDDLDLAKAALEKTAASLHSEEDHEGPLIEITVHYGGEAGPDLNRLAEAACLSTEAWIERHTDRIYTAEILGFTPGFAYLSGLDEALSVPRLSSPRVRVPVGAVAVSGGFSGVYPLGGPGGWALVGRTEERLFDPQAKDPFVIRPGTRVRFRRS